MKNLYFILVLLFILAISTPISDLIHPRLHSSIFFTLPVTFVLWLPGIVFKLASLKQIYFTFVVLVSSIIIFSIKRLVPLTVAQLIIAAIWIFFTAAFLFNKKFGYWGSFACLLIPWVYFGHKTIRRIVFIIENGGMERADGYGSPVAFLIHAIFEQYIFIPATFFIIWLFTQRRILLLCEDPNKPLRLNRTRGAGKAAELYVGREQE